MGPSGYDDMNQRVLIWRKKNVTTERAHYRSEISSLWRLIS